MSDPLPPSPGLLRRAVPLLAAAGYVGALGVWADGGAELSGWAAACAGIGVALLASGRRSGAARALGAGLAVAVAASGARAPHAGVALAGIAGALLASLVACRALAALPWQGGLARATPTSWRPWAAALAAASLAWAAPSWPGAAGLEGRVPGPAVSALGAAALVGALLLQAEWTMLRRRLELSVLERALGLRAIAWTGLALAGISALLGRGGGAGLARVVPAVVALALWLAARAEDPVRVARVARRLVALGIVGGAVAVLGASSVAGRGWDAWTATLLTGLATLGIGAAAAFLDAPMRPARGAWLDAFASAAAEAGRADPDEAVRWLLHALRAPGGPQGASPELWTVGPTVVTTVDAAGYARERPGDLPEALLVVAAGEPEASLRPEVLDALEVRRPELRPLARWMNDRGAMLATVVSIEGEAEALLVLPRCGRAEPVTLEEVRALKATADALGAACRARAAQARMLARVQEAGARADAADAVVDRLRHERALDVGRDALAAARLARPATVGIYSAGSRMALEALERRCAAGAPLAVVAASGVDPVPYLARAHLAGARRDAPLVLVDATSAREHDVARWNDPAASPLALADRGMLVLLDGAALPAEVQQIVARALAEKRAPWERPAPLDVQLAMTGVAPPEELVTQARLDPALAARLADARAQPVELPRLRDRAEDLRAILTDRLAREGLRVHGRPVGIDSAAYARLVDYGFPGEDAELAAIATRLVAGAVGDVVRASDVDALGLPAPDRGETSAGAGRRDPLSA